MSPLSILFIIVAYFVLLVGISWLTSRKADNESFFIANKSASWYLVAFGMIGTSLSGVTFISVPGKVGIANFSYLQIVLGYLLGYFIIATVLMPLYYRLNLVSIYGFLQQRLGYWAYKTGAFYFLLSRTVGSGARFYLAISVLHIGVFSHFGLPFWLSSLFGLMLIWLYTFKGGLKTIIYTDTLQTFFMLASVVISLIIIASALNTSFPGLVSTINQSDYSTMFVWDFNRPDYFWKQFVAGALIAITMTGLDQDMMQKNLACKNLKEAQKNMLWFCVALVIVNVLFQYLGAGLYLFSEAQNIAIPAKTDQLFPMLALQHFVPVAAVVFVLGIIAATYASTDSALAALTTSFCIDFLNLQQLNPKYQKAIRISVHMGFTLLMLVVVILLQQFDKGTLIDTIFMLAGYTYGPLLGLFSFGLFTKWQIRNHIGLVAVCLAAPALTYLVSTNSFDWIGYRFGFEIILLNGLITFLGLMLLIKKPVALA